jgi:hypothetical protein
MKGTVIVWGGGRRRSWKREALMIASTAGIATAVGARRQEKGCCNEPSGGVADSCLAWLPGRTLRQPRTAQIQHINFVPVTSAF